MTSLFIVLRDAQCSPQLLALLDLGLSDLMNLMLLQSPRIWASAAWS